MCINNRFNFSWLTKNCKPKFYPSSMIKHDIGIKLQLTIFNVKYKYADKVINLTIIYNHMTISKSRRLF